MSRFLNRDRDQAGTTLIEVLVTVMLMGVVSALVTSALITTHKSLRVTDDESRGLADVKTVAERLDRDIRDARGIVCDGVNLDGTADPTCSSHLEFWIDFNSNYKRDVGEKVIWDLQPLVGDANHFKVVRKIEGEAETVQATSLVVRFAFTYDTQPTATYTTTKTRVVTTGMTYDALFGIGTNNRTLNFITRLRNVA